MVCMEGQLENSNVQGNYAHQYTDRDSQQTWTGSPIIRENHATDVYTKPRQSVYFSGLWDYGFIRYLEQFFSSHHILLISLLRT